MPKTKVPPPPDLPPDRCNAKLHGQMKWCRHKAGARTKHPGIGKCWIHGGDTPIKTTGEHSPIHQEYLKGLVAKHLENQDPLNLLTEVAQLRAVVEDVFTRYETIFGPEGALMMWWEAKCRENTAEMLPLPKMPHIIPFESISGCIDKVGVMVERLQRREEKRGLTMADVQNILSTAAFVVVQEINAAKLPPKQSKKILDAIETRWASTLPDVRSAIDAAD